MTSEKKSINRRPELVYIWQERGWVIAPTRGGGWCSLQTWWCLDPKHRIIAGKRSNSNNSLASDNLLRLHAQVSATLSSVQRETSTRCIFFSNTFLLFFSKTYPLKDGRMSRRCWRTASRWGGGRWASSGSWYSGPGQSRVTRSERASC